MKDSRLKIQDSSNMIHDLQLATCNLQPSLDIVCSANLYWDETRWQRPNHIMSRLSKYCRILYVRPLDFRFYLRDRKRWGKSKRDFKVNQNLTIFFPIVFPFAERLKFISFLNKILMIIRIKMKIWSLGFKNIILWFYTPKSIYLMGRLNEKFIVYDIMDEHSKFNGAPKGIDETERRLIEKCNIVFTGTNRLWDEKREFNSNSHFFSCGVDYSHFAKAQDKNVIARSEIPRLSLRDSQSEPKQSQDRLGTGSAISKKGIASPSARNDRKIAFPDEMADIPSPVVGYVGAVDDRLDYDLIRKMAESHPEWSIVLIGPFVGVKQDDLPDMKNIFYLGGRRYNELPSYIKNFSVCIMPFKKNPLTDKINPTKALEYMAAGKPIVSTPIPDMEEFYSHIIKIGHDADLFIKHVEREIKSPDLKGISEGINLSRERTWEKVAESMYGIIQPSLH
ncbi:MAG: glycosyltransferase [Nitrospinae bacterium]|nr:glycosyltransferase [Nitrospinota bacterium]